MEKYETESLQRRKPATRRFPQATAAVVVAGGWRTWMTRLEVVAGGPGRGAERRRGRRADADADAVAAGEADGLVMMGC